MPSGRLPPLPRLERLVEDALSLRGIIAQNAFDGALRREKKVVFRYVIDTNIFDLYGEPGRLKNCKMVAALPSLIRAGRDEHRDDDDDDDDEGGDPSEPLEARKRQALIANALLTSEYIFKLSEGNDLPVLVSPEHTHEIISYVDGLERRALTLFRQPMSDLESVYATLQDRLQIEASAARSLATTNQGWLTRLRGSIVSLLAEASQSPLLAPYRIRGLFQGRMIANLADALELPVEIVSPPLDLIMGWRNRIKEVKDQYYSNSSAQALHADAVTLAQLELLNTDWDNKKQLCVLITRDRGLHRAYTKWRNERARINPKDAPPFALRDPRQFTPILNIAEMSGVYSDADVFDKVSALVTDFTSQFDSTDFHRSAPWNGNQFDPPDVTEIRAVVGTRLASGSPRIDPFAEKISDQLRTIDERWVEAIEYSIVAKADVISALAKRDARLWTQARSLKLLRSSFAEQIEEVRESFETLTTSSTLLRHELWAIEHGPYELIDAPGQNRRAVASTFKEYSSEIFAGQTLTEILENIRNRKVGAIQPLKEADRSERLFVTGCLSLQIGAWVGAKSLLDRAMAAAGNSGEFSHEVAVFRSMARRLAASQRDYKREYVAIRKTLQGLRPTPGYSISGEDPRVRNEQLALELCEIAFRSASGENHVAVVGRAGQYWERMYERYGTRLTDESIEPFWQSVSKQFILNTFDLLFWREVSDVEHSSLARKVATECLAALDAGNLNYVSSLEHGRIYPLLARYALAPLRLRAELASEIEKKILLAIERDDEGGIAFDLPYVDKAEFAGILKIVAPSRQTLISKMSEESYG